LKEGGAGTIATPFLPDYDATCCEFAVDCGFVADLSQFVVQRVIQKAQLSLK